MQTCSVETCNKTAKKAGMCWAHHKKKLVHGNPCYGREYQKNVTGKCLVNGCCRKYAAKGFCALHYQRVRIRGTYGPTGNIVRKVDRAICSVDGCTSICAHLEFCSKHYKYQYRAQPCSVQGCQRKYEAKGFCGFHYQRLRYYGNPLAEKPKRDYRRLPIGYKCLNQHGYVMVMVEKGNPHRMMGGYVFEHRLVMGESIGRPLLKHENVHHKDGNRQNNALENLELWVTMQPSGQRPSDLVEYAKRILSLYGNMA